MRYVAVLGVAARQTLNARGAIAARSAFYVVVLLIFSRLWGAMSGFIGAAEFLWYLALTEWTTLAMPHFYVGIEEDVRRGDIAYRLARPVSYFWAKFAEGMGEVLARLAALAPVGLVAAWSFAGGLPADPRGLLLAVPLSLLAAAVLVLMQIAIGLSAFWFQDASPCHWIVQKLLFVFGGLFIPLDIYPEWMQTIAHCTPFAPLVYGVGRSAFGFDPATAARTALLILAWGVVLLGLVGWLYRRSLRVLNVNGG